MKKLRPEQQKRCRACSCWLSMRPGYKSSSVHLTGLVWLFARAVNNIARGRVGWIGLHPRGTKGFILNTIPPDFEIPTQDGNRISNDLLRPWSMNITPVMPPLAVFPLFHRASRADKKTDAAGPVKELPARKRRFRESSANLAFVCNSPSRYNLNSRCPSTPSNSPATSRRRISS
jgi:hypothetical protein